MVLEKLGSSIHESIRKLVRLPIVDEKAIEEYLRDIQRALLQADVNVKIVLELTEKIRKGAKKKLPSGVSRRDHIIRLTYDEIVRILGGEKGTKLELKSGKSNVLMLVGIQGSGKTTTVAKLVKDLVKRGMKVGVICTDTYRPGALAQLKQMTEDAGVRTFGEEKEKNAVKIAQKGVEIFKEEGVDVILLDTAGRHKDEDELLSEMKEMADYVNPDQIILVVDGTIGQQAALQAEKFNETTSIGGIIISKLDSSARGGGALSAVATTGAPILYIGTGEKVEDLESFEASRFVSRLLGMGDITSLVSKVREAEIPTSKKHLKAVMSGKLTLVDVYEQLESMRRMGPLGKILTMVPGLGYNIPKDQIEIVEKKIKRWRYVIDSMTEEEKRTPKILNSKRIKRIARGSGTTERDVRELIQQYRMMRKMMRTLARKKTPLFKGMPR
jgi:signal recognition particle subunit SRP54